MAYQVLSRKWRPQKFEDVIGQQHVTSTLQNSIEQDRLAHAYLFTGPRGIGKTTTARILAKYLNCKNPKDLNPCNECKNCTEITAGRSFDVREIDGASNTGVDNIRDLREEVKYPPTDGDFKIYIIDEVHMLSTSAFNALLKTLEEPPSHVKFIFATTEPEKVLPTIISRTQRFDFKRIPLPKIIGLLKTICESEDVDISDGALTLIARKADGSMRDAESLLDQVISFSGEEVTDESVASILGIVSYDLYLHLSEILHEHDVSGALDLISEVMSAGYDLSEFLDGLSDFWRNLLVLDSTDDYSLLDVPDSYREEFESAAAEYDSRDLLRLLNLTLSAQQQFRDARSHRIFVENFLLKLVHFTESITLDQLAGDGKGGSPPESTPSEKQTEESKSSKSSSGTTSKTRRNIGQKKTRLPGSEDKSGKVSDKSGQKSANPTGKSGQNPGKPAVESAKKPETQESKASETLPLSEFQERWPEFAEFVHENKPILGEYLSECVPNRAEGKVLSVVFDTSAKFHMKSIERKSRQVEKLIKKFFDAEVRFKCLLGDTGKKSEDDEGEDIIDDPITQAIISNFDGEIIN
ncbi:MAG: DNA polymerase III subunit gamma/tau [Candidatus Marinimicrobia bacterium]|nr:DNA polymerase III subunit gamma/tau [Candidatus Neomarinimicrobiota bacterium]MCF7828071.1 DNA polymerase III subunit gamma/tau [Candidatus Neomarinimicrobiota bacterium]MCF7879754.1 DNA polymerase III subunit gamma/tau [Candidatus Neomarinimicrobiota bacterium]